MTTFLFPTTAAPQGPRPRNAYGTMYTDIVRACSDAVDALSLYRRLVVATDTSADSVGFSAFDAHVGDTSCQLRAGMLLDLTKKHRELALHSGRAAWLDTYIEKLVSVRDKGREMLAKLTIDRIHPMELGIGPKRDTPAGLLRQLGWCEPEMPSSPGALYPSFQGISQPRKSHVTGWNSIKEPITSSQQEHVWWQTSSDPLFLSNSITSHEDTPMVIVDDVGSETSVDNISKKYGSPASSEADAGMEWDPLDTSTIVRFLTYCFVLSKYKTFRRFDHVVGARLNAKAVIHEGDGMVRDVWERSLFHYKYSNTTRRIDVEFGFLQSWISELSCAWLCYTAKRSSAFPGIESLMMRTIQTSTSRLTCIPTYVGYLVIRELWGKSGDALILVDRHFCNDGHHSNFFLATLKLESVNASDECGHRRHCLPLKHRVSWEIETISKDWLIKHTEQGLPHIVIMGNSIDGSYEDYLKASCTSQQHNEQDCQDNEAHIAKFLAHDHDRLTLSFFARHKHYTFDLNGRGNVEGVLDERANVAKHMNHVFPGLAEQWHDSDKEAEIMGTAGDSLYMFAWQHAFIETKGRIAKLVAEAKDTLPISAPLERI